MRGEDWSEVIRQTYGWLGSAGNGDYAEKNGNRHPPETAWLLIMSFLVHRSRVHNRFLGHRSEEATTQQRG